MKSTEIRKIRRFQRETNTQLPEVTTDNELEDFRMDFLLNNLSRVIRGDCDLQLLCDIHRMLKLISVSSLINCGQISVWFYPFINSGDEERAKILDIFTVLSSHTSMFDTSIFTTLNSIYSTETSPKIHAIIMNLAKNSSAFSDGFVESPLFRTMMNSYSSTKTHLELLVILTASLHQQIAQVIAVEASKPSACEFLDVYCELLINIGHNYQTVFESLVFHSHIIELLCISMSPENGRIIDVFSVLCDYGNEFVPILISNGIPGDIARFINSGECLGECFDFISSWCVGCEGYNIELLKTFLSIDFNRVIQSSTMAVKIKCIECTGNLVRIATRDQVKEFISTDFIDFLIDILQVDDETIVFSAKLTLKSIVEKCAADEEMIKYIEEQINMVFSFCLGELVHCEG